MAVKEISPFDFNESPFRVIGKDWLLVTGEYEGKSNGMTASWGGLGIMWGKPVAYIFIVTMLCRKLYAQPLASEFFIDKSCDEKWYKDDYHTMYVVEIEKLLVKE